MKTMFRRFINRKVSRVHESVMDTFRTAKAGSGKTWCFRAKNTANNASPQSGIFSQTFGAYLVREISFVSNPQNAQQSGYQDIWRETADSFGALASANKAEYPIITLKGCSAIDCYRLLQVNSQIGWGGSPDAEALIAAALLNFINWIKQHPKKLIPWSFSNATPPSEQESLFATAKVYHTLTHIHNNRNFEFVTRTIPNFRAEVELAIKSIGDLLKQVLASRELSESEWWFPSLFLIYRSPSPTPVLEASVITRQAVQEFESVDNMLRIAQAHITVPYLCNQSGGQSALAFVHIAPRIDLAQYLIQNADDPGHQAVAIAFGALDTLRGYSNSETAERGNTFSESNIIYAARCASLVRSFWDRLDTRFDSRSKPRSLPSYSLLLGYLTWKIQNSVLSRSTALFYCCVILMLLGISVCLLLVGALLDTVISGRQLGSVVFLLFGGGVICASSITVAATFAISKGTTSQRLITAIYTLALMLATSAGGNALSLWGKLVDAPPSNAVSSVSHPDKTKGGASGGPAASITNRTTKPTLLSP
jgi:hypothetical protein